MNPITKIASMFIALCCTMVFFGQSSYADPQETIVSGPIFQNTTWSKAGSPYIVNGSVLVMSDAVLTIDAGVEVRFDAEKAISIQKGTLIARGTAAEPIKFTANTTLPQRGFWGYIQFEADSVDATLDANGAYVSGSILQHVIVEYAGYRPQFSQESGAIRVKDAAPLIDQSVVRNSSSDGINVAMGSITISQSRIDDNNGAGIYIYNDYAGSCPPLPVSITDNIVSGNSDEAAYGASFYVHAAGKLIRGNLVENNSGSGIYAASCNYNEPLSARMVVDNNVVRFNNGGQYSQHAINAHWSTVSNNEVYGNKGPGISIRDGVATAIS
ncbi:MAG: right-handed parallel beta-helix repeat-containing protein [Caldilineaceae bacterium]